jgi:hypothetical protein
MQKLSGPESLYRTPSVLWENADWTLLLNCFTLSAAVVLG